MPVESLPESARVIARISPFTYAVSLLRGICQGAGWLARAADVAVPAVMLVLFVGLSAPVFRWE